MDPRRAFGRSHRSIRRQLDLSHFVRVVSRGLDQYQLLHLVHAAPGPISLHIVEPDPFLPRGDSTADHYDEPKPAGGERSSTFGTRLSGESQSRVGNSPFARKARSFAVAPMGTAGTDSGNTARVAGGDQPATLNRTETL